MKSLWTITAAWIRRTHRRHPTLTGVAMGGIAAAMVWILSHHQSDDSPPPRIVGPLAHTGLTPRSEPPVHPGETMRGTVALALGYGEDVPAPARIRELMNLREALTADEINELLRALLANSESSLEGANHSTWFHEVANLLQRQEVRHVEFAEVLATVARDSKRGRATRDYALQHLRRVWGRAENDPRLRKSIEVTLNQMAATNDDLQPTVLLSLHLIDPDGRNGVDDTELRFAVNAAMSAALQPEDPRTVRLRMAAARIAGERRMADLREPLLEIAGAEDDHALVRMSAVSALGMIGAKSDLNALASLSPSDDRVAAAIRHAVKSKTPR